ncbi:MAG: LptF/LptG family permease [Planctomycetota bacterium]|jgi:lipopolysaccharide export LptBFGC system permease protein LptF|nr:LptF/LptG family permease [Planctomycetota bacterium]
MAKTAGIRPAAGRDDDLGATGFYYVAPAGNWEENLAGKRSYSHLIILPAYIWRELIKGVILSIAVFSLILMAVFAGQVMRDGIGPHTLALILPNFLPLICPFVLPLAIITGIIICYSRLSRDNEILAAYAGGAHPLWVMLPAILTSIIAIFVTLSLNESALMPAIGNIERLVIEDQADILRRMLSRPGNITVQAGGEYLAMSKLPPSAIDGQRAVINITRFVRQPAGEAAADFAWNPAFPYPAKRMVARDHQLQDMRGDAADRLVLKMLVTKPVFQDLHPSKINKTFIADGASGEERIVMGGRPSVTIHSNRSSFWPILKLSSDRREGNNDIKEMEAALERLDGLAAEQRAQMENRLAGLRKRVATRTSEINMRLALCFSCLAFAVIGIPLGLRAKGTLASSFAIGIAVSGLYFLALKTLQHRVGDGLAPYWVIWLPDAVVMLAGIVLWLTDSRRV